MKSIIEPIHSFKSTIAEIANKLIIYSDIYFSPKPKGDQKQEIMSKEMANLASKLQSKMYLDVANCAC